MQTCSEAEEILKPKLLLAGVGILRYYHEVYTSDKGCPLIVEWLLGKLGTRSVVCALAWDSGLPTDEEIARIGEFALLAFRRMAYVAPPGDRLALWSNPFIFQKTPEGSWKMCRRISQTNLVHDFGTGLLSDFGQIIFSGASS